VRQAWRRGGLGSLALVAALGSAACELPSFGAPHPASREGSRIFSLWQGFFVAACAVGAFMLVLILYTLLRYRARGSDRIPLQGSVNVPAEVIYTATPIVIVAVLFAFSFSREQSVTKVSAAPAEVVRVTAFQWGWEFHYPAEGITITGSGNSPGPELVLPVGVTTRLELVSHDVIHSFYVPQFLEKRDLVPGLDNAIDVTPTKTGVFAGRCAEYCGLDHWRMDFSTRVLPEPEFRQWAKAQSQGAAKP